MKYRVFQFQLADSIIDRMSKGTATEADNTIYRQYLDCVMIPTVERVIAVRSCYKEVALIEADDLEQVFTIGNIGDEDNESAIQYLAPMHSISVGDVIVDESGIAHLVDKIGFKELTQYTANQVEEYVEFV